MKLKTFREFIKEDFRTSLFRKGLIDNNEINFYFEKLETINLKRYMSTFINRETYNFLTDLHYGKPKYLRFFLFFYDNIFYIYVFNGHISHLNFITLLETLNESDMISFSELYFDCFKRYKKPQEKEEHLKTLNTIWCFPGIYTEGNIKAFASSIYMNLLAQLNIHKKLGFNDNTWITLID